MCRYTYAFVQGRFVVVNGNHSPRVQNLCQRFLKGLPCTYACARKGMGERRMCWWCMLGHAFKELTLPAQQPSLGHLSDSVPVFCDVTFVPLLLLLLLLVCPAG